MFRVLYSVFRVPCSMFLFLSTVSGNEVGHLVTSFMQIINRLKPIVTCQPGITNSANRWFSMAYLLNSFTRKKFVDPETLTSTQLSRCLSIFDLTVLGIGSTLGAGIYVLAGDVARNDAGPSIVISFAIAAIASILSGLCYGEFGARVPKAGSAYVYSYVAIGELCAFVIGWNLILEYVIGTSSVARAWSAYFDSLFDGRIKNFTISTIGEVHVKGLAEYLDVLSVLVVLGLTVVLVVGIKKTSWFNTVFTAINMFVILFIVCVGCTMPSTRTGQTLPRMELQGFSLGQPRVFTRSLVLT